MSEYKTISCGVPQGSHLVLFFLPYLSTTFHPLWTFPLKFLLIYFIKDTNGWREQMTNRISPFRRIHLLQRVSERIRADHVQQIQLYRRRSIAPEEWAESWHGKSGLAKARILSINKDIMLEAFTPTMEGHAVTVTENHRHLWVVLSEDLKWSKHAKCIMAAASKRAGLLSLMARDLLLSVVSILYVYNVRPVLELPVQCGTALSGKRTQCPWNGYRPVLRVVFSKLTGLHQKRNFSDSSAGQHLDGDGK